MADALKWIFYLAASAVGLAAFLAVGAFVATAGVVIGGIAILVFVIWVIASMIRASVENKQP